MTDEQHNKYIAFTFLAYGGFQLLMTLMIGVIFYLASLPTRPGAPPPPVEFFGFFFAFMFIFQMIFAAPSFVAAYALLKRKSWARLASIIAGVMSAASVPVGTAACVYAMWFFFGENWKRVYPQEQKFDDGYHEHLQLMQQQHWSGTTAQGFNFEEKRTTTPPDWR